MRLEFRRKKIRRGLEVNPPPRFRRQQNPIHEPVAGGRIFPNRPGIRLNTLRGRFTAQHKGRQIEKLHQGQPGRLQLPLEFHGKFRVPAQWRPADPNQERTASFFLGGIQDGRFHGTIHNQVGVENLQQFAEGPNPQAPFPFPWLVPTRRVGKVTVSQPTQSIGIIDDP